MTTNFTLQPRSPFEGVSDTPIAGEGVRVAYRDGLGLAIVLANKGQTGILAQRVREHFGIELPDGPRRVNTGDIGFAGFAPESWLATREDGGNAFSESLRQVIGDCAAIVDHTDGYVVLRLTGAKVREALAKIVPIDLHASAFKPGDVAVTMAAHMDATLWRLEDAGGVAVFEIAVFRSFAGSFWHSLCECTAEFGLTVETSARRR